MAASMPLFNMMKVERMHRDIAIPDHDGRGRLLQGQVDRTDAVMPYPA